MLQRYQTLFQTLKNTLPGNQTAWIAKLRENALDLFLREGFPTTQDEDWKFTSLRKLPMPDENAVILRSAFCDEGSPCDREILRRCAPQDDNFIKAPQDDSFIKVPQDDSIKKTLLKMTTKKDVINLVFINGAFSSEHSDELPASVQLIADCMNQQPEILEPFLMDPRLRGNDKTKYEAFRELNTAFMQNGAFIRVPKGQLLKIHLRFLTTQTQTIEAAYWRNIIVLEENARATVIESYDGDTENNYLTNTITEIFLHKSAHLTHYKWQNESHQAFHFGKIYVHQNFEASQFDNHTVSLGGQLSRSDIHVALKAPKTRCLLNGLYRLSNIQHMDHQTTIDHQTHNATSQELYKGIMDDQSHGVFNGKVLVQKDAQKTVSEQRNHNLLLSLDAQINTKPQLEILADDVKCAHGATVGQLDETAMFYLRSRGLDEKIARQTLIQAFFTDVLENMPDEFFREQVKQCL